jgi:hypothetical protein
MHEEIGLETIMQILEWLVAAALAILLFAAQMQLFSISKTLKLILEEVQQIRRSSKAGTHGV